MAEQDKSGSDRAATPGKQQQPLFRLFVPLILAIFAVETGIMLLFHYVFPPLPTIVDSFVDGILLVLALTPLIFWIVLRPFRQQLAERHRVLETLRESEERYRSIFENSISKRKDAEQELRDACQHLQERQVFIESIVASIESGLIVTDTDLRIALVNSYVLSLFGKSAEEITGMALADFCPELNAKITAGVSGEEIRVGPGKQELTIGYNCTEMKGVGGAVAGRIIAFKDLTEVMKIRREMQAKERLAAIGEVVARVAHEVRNPLFGITAAAQLLAMEIQLTPPQKELMTSLLSEARRLNHLVEELLDCSKEMKLDMGFFDLLKTVNESIGGNELFIAEKRLTVVRQFPLGKFMLTADPGKIKQVLLNIVKNAVDASLPGGEIGIVVAVLEGEVSIRVSDCGPGIPVEIMDKVFDVFYTTKKHGTGLGLAISRHIVEAHGGRLLASNNGAGGATFSVVLPFVPGTALRAPCI